MLLNAIRVPDVDRSNHPANAYFGCNPRLPPTPPRAPLMINADMPQSETALDEHRPARVFVGLKVAPGIAVELAQIAGELARLPIRPVPPTDIHLTLVPPWNEESIPDAITKLRLVASTCSAFPLKIQRVGYGPEPRRPRLLWADCEVSDELIALRAALLDAYGDRDERPFRPHLTLARIRGNGAAIARKHPMDREVALIQQVASIELFRSPPPGESGYRVLASSRFDERLALQ